MKLNNITFTIIKPTAVKENLIAKILEVITSNDFRIVALKMIWFSEEEAKKFYFVHKEQYFYQKLCDYMVSGPVVIAVLEKKDAVSLFRQLIGNTNPQVAEKGTIRNVFGKNTTENAIHGSDSDENALIELNLFFNSDELFL